MPRHTVYVVARGEDAVAAPFDIVAQGMRQAYATDSGM
jgi:hypothetical protein